ncbi:MAG: hypothetical protein NC452_13175 [Eubacterium sp.]|nr:hypothetical protein [Eubacterium sp.]
MDKIIKLTAMDFLKKAKSLDIGEFFYCDFKKECDGEPQCEEELENCYSVHKLSLFGNEMILVSKYDGTYCRVLFANTEFFAFGVDSVRVYTVDKEAQKRETTISLTPSFCIDIRGCTNCGGNVFIPSRQVHELATEIDKYNVSADVFSKAEELSKANDFTPEEVNRMAEIVIDRRDDCGVISEAYWQIVEETIEEFASATRS